MILLLITLLGASSCFMKDDTTGALEVELILHAKQASYTIGEPINPQLEIVNNGSQKIVFNDFAFDGQTLIYYNSCAIHLVSPEGEDLALPYQGIPSEIDSMPPITVEANNKEWMFLPIYSHFHLRRPGKYIFWLELESTEGIVYASNRLEFQINPVKLSTPTENITLNLDTQNLIFEKDRKIEVKATFGNKSNQAVKILMPQEDSFYGWTNPTYQFTIIDGNGRIIPLAQRGGTMPLPVYDEDKQLTVESGGHEKVLLPFPPLSRNLSPGNYQVKLSYLVREKQIGKAGTIIDQYMDWSKDVFVGLLESDTINITIK